MSILSESKVKTRKPHRCYACDRTFPEGTTMHKQVNVSDGIHSVYWCETCDILIKQNFDFCFDESEQSYSESCISELCSVKGVKTPEELLVKDYPESNRNENII